LINSGVTSPWRRPRDVTKHPFCGIRQLLATGRHRQTDRQRVGDAVGSSRKLNLADPPTVVRRSKTVASRLRTVPLQSQIGGQDKMLGLLNIPYEPAAIVRLRDIVDRWPPGRPTTLSYSCDMHDTRLPANSAYILNSVRWHSNGRWTRDARIPE